MPIEHERFTKSWREEFITWVVNRLCKLLGWRMLLLSIARVEAHGEDLELKEMRVIRSTGTQKFPSHPMTQALFAGLMELQMNHLRELQNEQRSRQQAAPPSKPEVHKKEVVN